MLFLVKLVHIKLTLYYHWLTLYCLPILLYGVESVQLTKTECIRLNHPLDMVFSKIFRTFSKDIIRDCFYYMHYLPLRYDVDLRTLLFICRIMRHQPEHSIVKILFKNVGINEFNLIAAKYNASSTDSFSLIKYKVWSVFGNGWFNGNLRV